MRLKAKTKNIPKHNCLVPPKNNYLTPIKFRLPLIFRGLKLKGANWTPKLGEGRKLKGANWALKIGGSEN